MNNVFKITPDERTAKNIIKFIRSKKQGFWKRQQEATSLSLFHRASKEVPAYKDFLHKNKIDPRKIRTFRDFQTVPLIDKNSYLRKYSLEKLVWEGNLKKPLVFTATSGSTGEPFYFPRSSQLDWESSIIHEVFLRNGFRSEAGPTLVIIGFGMGVWIGGLITYKAFEIASNQNGYSVSIISPGIHKEEIFKALKNLAPHYRQVILTGYPPFVKDIIDEAPERGIKLKKLNIRLLFAAECFTEKFRDHLAEKAGIKNIYLDTLNVYGTADIGTMAYETPISILIRRLAIKNRRLFEYLFSNITKVPTLAQYNPLFNCFESLNGNVVVTGDNAIPLVRYSLGDHGGVMNFTEVKEKLKNCGINLKLEAKNAGIQNYIYELPFVFVYERADFFVKLHLRDINPEIIRDVLIDKTFNKFLSGKFTMATKYNHRHNQYLEINLELRKNRKLNGGFKSKLSKNILAAISSKTSGPGSQTEFVKRKDLLKIIFWPAEHPLHFKSGVKQKWVKRQ